LFLDFPSFLAEGRGLINGLYALFRNPFLQTSTHWVFEGLQGGIMIVWDVDNIKCGGCANRITQKLQAIVGVTKVSVDIEQSQIHFEANESVVADVEHTLISLGYPRSGTTSGLSAVGADVRSVVSCAIGRLQREDV